MSKDDPSKLDGIEGRAYVMSSAGVMGMPCSLATFIAPSDDLVRLHVELPGLKVQLILTPEEADTLAGMLQAPQPCHPDAPFFDPNKP
jgi:hypothetical protein